MVKKAVISSCHQVLGQKIHSKRYQRRLLNKKIDQRKNRKSALNNSRTRPEKVRAQTAYTEANKVVRKNIRADKGVYLDSLAIEAEEAAHRGNMKTIYANTKSSLEYLPSRRDAEKTRNGPQLPDKKDEERGGWGALRSF